MSGGGTQKPSTKRQAELGKSYSRGNEEKAEGEGVSDRSDQPLEFYYRNMSLERRVELARQSGMRAEDFARMAEIKKKLKDSMESQKAQGDRIDKSLAVMPMSHALRTQSRDGEVKEDRPGVKPVFNDKYRWLFRPSEDRVPFDAESDRNAEHQWAIRKGQGKFPCRSLCLVCHSKPDGHIEHHGEPGNIDEVLGAQTEGPEKAPPGCACIKHVPDYIRRTFQIKEMDHKLQHVGGFPQSFRWLMEHLLPPSDRIKGCELIFPDTAFFSGGSLVLMIKMDKDFCVEGVRNRKKLSVLKFVKNFQIVMK